MNRQSMLIPSRRNVGSLDVLRGSVGRAHTVPGFFLWERVTAPEHDVIAAKTSTSDLPVVGEMIVN